MTEIILVMNGHMTKSCRKLMYGQMTQNIPKCSFLALSATRWTCGRSLIYHFFAHGAHESVGKKNFFFAQRLKKKLFCINFDGLVGKLETRLFFFLSLRTFIVPTQILFAFLFVVLFALLSHQTGKD